MEVTGRDGDCEPWIYSYLGLGNTGYTPFSIGSPSSSSGTIVSTAYTSSGSGSGMSYVEAVMPFPRGNYAKLTRIQKKQHIKSLVQEFFGAPSANCSIIEGGGDMSVLERWFADLGLGWVLQLDEGVASARVFKYTNSFALRWVSGLFEITDSIRMQMSSFSEITSPDDASIREAFQFAQFIQIAMLKMFAFVDVVVARNAETIHVTNGLPTAPAYHKLSSLLSVCGALSMALWEIPLLFRGKDTWITFSPIKAEEDEKIVGEIVSLLSAKEAKAAEAVSSTIQRISRELTSVDDSWSSQGSPDIHIATRSVMGYISFLQSSYSSMAPFVSQAVLACLRDKSVHSLDSMTVEMISCLEERLVKVSESFPDQGLRFLFLLNNLYFIQESLLFFTFLKKAGNKDRRHRPLNYSSLDIHVAALFEKVDRHMENYVQESWDPVLSCLFHPSPTPLCLLTRSNSGLPKFESAFRKTYSTQKLWKVPDPKLRKRLRTAIIDKIVPDYTKYVEENNIATPEFTPKEMEEMLKELFEG